MEGGRREGGRGDQTYLTDGKCGKILQGWSVEAIDIKSFFVCL